MVYVVSRWAGAARGRVKTIFGGLNSLLRTPSGKWGVQWNKPTPREFTQQAPSHEPQNTKPLILLILQNKIKTYSSHRLSPLTRLKIRPTFQSLTKTEVYDFYQSISIQRNP